jgi:hypothetical protein
LGTGGEDSTSPPFPYVICTRNLFRGTGFLSQSFEVGRDDRAADVHHLRVTVFPFAQLEIVSA